MGPGAHFFGAPAAPQGTPIFMKLILSSRLIKIHMIQYKIQHCTLPNPISDCIIPCLTKPDLGPTS